MFALSTTFAVAQVSDFEFMTKMNEGKSLKALAKYVEAGFEQYGDMRMVLNSSAYKMEKAIESNDEAQVKKALNFNLANMRAILTKEQYRKYLTLLNVSYYNKQNLLAVKK